MSGQYAERNASQKSYRPRAGTMSPGLKRAREPYRVKNALVGLGLTAFAVGVWAYSISAVKQDVFDDVDEEARELSAVRNNTTAAPSEIAASSSAAAATPVEKAPEPTATSTSQVAAPAAAIVLPHAGFPPAVGGGGAGAVCPIQQRRGVLYALDKRYPGLLRLHPLTKTLIWGAPPVDNIGKMSLRSSSSS